MREEQWLSETDDPYEMLNFLGKRVSSRKAKLFACACFRLGSSPLKMWEQKIVEVVERYADGLASEQERQHAEEVSTGKSGIAWVTMTGDYWTAVEAGRAAGEWRDEPLQCALVREFFGNPFRPLPPRKGKRQWRETLRAWLTWNEGVIPMLAQAIYEERTFQRLSILADALEDAGCASADLLTHCRSGGEHVRGCWVVDLLLGKS